MKKLIAGGAVVTALIISGCGGASGSSYSAPKVPSKSPGTIGQHGESGRCAAFATAARTSHDARLHRIAHAWANSLSGRSPWALWGR